MKEQTQQLDTVPSCQGCLKAERTPGDIVQHFVGVFAGMHHLANYSEDQIHEAHEQTRQ